jgi:hypothetical protein
MPSFLMGYHCDKAGRMNNSFTAIVFSHHTDSTSSQSPNHFKHNYLASSDRQLSHSEQSVNQNMLVHNGIFHEQCIRFIK